MGFGGYAAVVGVLWGGALFLGDVVQIWAVWKHHDGIADRGTDEGD